MPRNPNFTANVVSTVAPSVGARKYTTLPSADADTSSPSAAAKGASVQPIKTRIGVILRIALPLVVVALQAINAAQPKQCRQFKR